jgi:hypothetical protein
MFEMERTSSSNGYRVRVGEGLGESTVDGNKDQSERRDHMHLGLL